jgi:7-cyano-7-deazaguanine synthase in queuosine biosynthesis
MPTTNIRIGSSQSTGEFLLCPGQNLYTGIKPLEQHFGSKDSLEEDLLNFASGIYGADLATNREEREHYIRSFNITVEVVNLQAFLRVKDALEQCLFRLSHDNWSLNFVQKEGLPVTNFGWDKNQGIVLLFSGGLDSMCAASKFLSEEKEIVLVSHNTQGNRIVDEAQNRVHSVLEDYYHKTIKHYHLKVYGRTHGQYQFPEDRENSQRTRSFLFLTLASLVTRRVGFEKVVFMAENGQFAIHLPLNQARVGPFSTHTADPEFLSLVQDIFRILLSNPVFEIYNPFLYLTKAEVFSCLPKDLQNQAYHSSSCWMISRTPGNKHCGHCIPCISRRIALEFNGIKFNEYAIDIFSEEIGKLSSDDQRKNIIDYLEFITKFQVSDLASLYGLVMEFPELINNYFDQKEALMLYNRMSNQSLEVFRKYPEIMKILG